MTGSEVLLLSGGPHPFAETTPILTRVIEDEGGRVTVVERPEAAADLLSAGTADLLVLNTLRWRMSEDRYADQRGEHAYASSPTARAAIGDWILGGGRVLACHAAVVCFDDWPEWGSLLGARWHWDRSSHPPLGEVAVHVAAPDHPLVCGLADAVIVDECYGFLDHTIAIDGLLTGQHGGAVHPLLWEHRPGAGHVVVSLLGHGPDSFRHPLHDAILRRALRHLVGAVT
ncbi:MAG: ThuA domain-containing protein [Acidimicrobiales bacterium]